MGVAKNDRQAAGAEFGGWTGKDLEIPGLTWGKVGKQVVNNFREETIRKTEQG